MAQTVAGISIHGVDIVGAAPGDLLRRLYIFYYETDTERAILDAFADEHLRVSDPDHSIAWIHETKDRDSLRHERLSEFLSDTDNINIVPVSVAWKPKTQQQQSWRAIMGWTHLTSSEFRQRRLLKAHPERCAIIIGEGAHLDELRLRHKRHAERDDDDNEIKSGEALADYVAMQAALTIERDARVITGETIKYPRFVRRALWSRRSLQSQLEAIAGETGRPIAKVREEARVCIHELVPNARAAHISAAWALSRAVCRLGYEDKLVYDKDKVAELRRIALTRPLALVFTHKTHIDGIAMILATRDECFPLVHMIGGENMAFAGVGYLMRRAGAVFIRRKIDCPIYKVVMREYLSYLMEKRFPVSWALEGTRSRNGKLMPPRYGILKYVVEAGARQNMRDLTIVPVSIYYDLIAELSDYAIEQTGAKKRKESLAWMADYLRSLRKPLGRISFAFGNPVMVDTTSLDIADAGAAGKDSFSAQLQKLAFQASVNANAVTPITPSSLFMLILTGAAPKALTENEINERILALRNWARERMLPVTDDIRKFDANRLRAVADAIIEMGVVARYDDGPEAVFSIERGKHFEASYYRNTAIHFFVTKAIAELSLAKAGEAEVDPLGVFWAEAGALRDLFKFEFFYPPADQFNTDVESEMRRYDENWSALITAGRGGDLLAAMTPLMAHAVLRPFAEAYSLVADVISDDHASSEAPTKKALVDEALKYARQALLQQRITSEESIGKLMFENGYELAAHRRLIDGDKSALAVPCRQFREDLNDVNRRLRLIKTIAEKCP